ncbi:MAG: PadR family transcriptional regulator [Clostridiales bacterium]|nr:PadR family transcriptional regulator [Clostridiales bacterium]
MNAKNYFLSGVTELLILSVLKNHDAYVYEIVKTINDMSGNSFSISQNTIYASTYKLQEENKITEHSKLVGKRRTRVYYHIEKSGLEYLSELLENYRVTTSCVNTMLDSLMNGQETAEEEENEQKL